MYMTLRDIEIKKKNQELVFSGVSGSKQIDTTAWNLCYSAQTNIKVNNHHYTLIPPWILIPVHVGMLLHARHSLELIKLKAC